MDLRPQAHEIIRTWLFATVVRSRAEHGQLPWHTADISGWIVAPDRQEDLQVQGQRRRTGPIELLDQYGADAVRYWSACGRPGVDLALDEGQMKVGRRLATKLLNASRFVLGLVQLWTLPVTVTDRWTARCWPDCPLWSPRPPPSFDDYDHTGALAATEAFFWEFCDDYIELVKERAYGDGAAAARPGPRWGRARRPAAPVRAVPAVRDGGGLVLVRSRLDPPLGLARTGRAAGRR